MIFSIFRDFGGSGLAPCQMSNFLISHLDPTSNFLIGKVDRSRSSGGVGRSPAACILVPVTMRVDLTCFGSVLASSDKDLASTSKKLYTISGYQGYQ